MLFYSIYSNQYLTTQYGWGDIANKTELIFRSYLAARSQTYSFRVHFQRVVKKPFLLSFLPDGLFPVVDYIATCKTSGHIRHITPDGIAKISQTIELTGPEVAATVNFLLDGRDKYAVDRLKAYLLYQIIE